MTSSTTSRTPHTYRLVSFDAYGQTTSYALFLYGCRPILTTPSQFYVIHGPFTCTPCAAGTNSSTTGATACDATTCLVDEKVVNNACVACPTGKTNAADDDASGGNTTCDATLCAANQYVSNNACVACADGKTNAADDDASGGNTTCYAIVSCATGYYLSLNDDRCLPRGSLPANVSDADIVQLALNNKCITRRDQKEKKKKRRTIKRTNNNNKTIHTIQYKIINSSPS